MCDAASLEGDTLFFAIVFRYIVWLRLHHAAYSNAVYCYCDVAYLAMYRVGLHGTIL